MSHVFISYSLDAKPWAEKLAQFLDGRGLTTWADFRDVKPGGRFQTEISKALADAKCFVIVVGPKSEVGELQDREWQGALQRTWEDPATRIFPVLIAGADAPAFLKDWAPLRVRPGKDPDESAWMVQTYEALSEVKGNAVKAKVKVGKALQTRLTEIERAAKALKSSRGG